MFERFVRFSQVKRALREGRLEEALKLLRDPLIAKDRRAAELRDRALRGLLERARGRHARGDHAPALVDVDLVLAAQPEFAGAQTLRGQLRGSLRTHEERARAGRSMLRRARERLQAGDLAAAEDLCGQSAVTAAHAAGQRAVTELIAGQRRAAGSALALAEAALEAGDLAQALESLGRARSQDRDTEALGRLERRVKAELGRHYAAQIRATGPGRLGGVLAQLGQDLVRLSGLVSEAQLAEALGEAADAAHGRLLKACREDGLGAAVRYLDAIPPLLKGHGRLRPLRPALEALVQAVAAEERGDPQEAAECLRLAAADLRVVEIERAKVAAEARVEQAASALWSARALAASGKLMAARQALLEVLGSWPAYQPARREMEILNHQAQERDERLNRARTLAGERQLRAASAILLELAADEHGEEARLLLKDVQARMDLVAEGLAQVRRALHGQASSSVAGLRHCLGRVEELTKVQVDSEEVAQLREALVAEIAGLEILERLDEAMAHERPPDAGDAMAEFLAQRCQMQPPQRLDARLLDVVDQVLQSVETAVEGARLQRARDWLQVLTDLPEEHGDAIQRRESLSGQVEERMARAGACLAEARQAAASGKVERATAQLTAAREIWLDSKEAEQVAEVVRQTHSQDQQVQEVERLTGSKDYAEAERRLRELPPTPPHLRTRIFDIKQGLAKAQGLAQGFILRVDEGGEYLVLRSDSFTIGNVRDRWADVQVLANVAGRHARINRSMSFHGGMQDKVIAERGEVSVNGRPIQDLELQSGDEITLGNTLSMIYTVPTKRSLSALLTLKGGFQVAGTDKLVLLKDRGRDGRILIGRAPDCHIRVPHDGPEIEIYGAQDGQIRVRFAGKGEMDGRPFRGEHPVTAGVVVRCGSVSMVLQPWAPTT